jgi:hypothetical protein
MRVKPVKELVIIGLTVLAVVLLSYRGSDYFNRSIMDMLLGATAESYRMRVQLQQSKPTNEHRDSEVISQSSPVTVSQLQQAIDRLVSRISNKNVREAAESAAETLKNKVAGWPPTGVSSIGNVARETFKAKEGGIEKTFRLDIENLAGTNCKQ